MCFYENLKAEFKSMAVASLASSAFTRIGDELGPETTRLKSVFPTDMILSVSEKELIFYVCEKYFYIWIQVITGRLSSDHADSFTSIFFWINVWRCYLQFQTSRTGNQLTESERSHIIFSGHCRLSISKCLLPPKPNRLWKWVNFCWLWKLNSVNQTNGELLYKNGEALHTDMSYIKLFPYVFFGCIGLRVEKLEPWSQVQRFTTRK